MCCIHLCGRSRIPSRIGRQSKACASRRASVPYRAHKEYFSSPLSDIYNNFSCRELDECGFTQILRADIPGDDGGYGKNNSFCCAVRKLRKELSLNDGIYTALIEFGSALGCCCSEELISRCSFLEELLSETCALQREELPKKTRLHTSLGTGLGMMLVILLI